MKFEENNEENIETTIEQQDEPQGEQQVLFQVFEQGARACQDWESSQKRINCLIALQSSETLALIPDTEKGEILTVLNSLLQSGQLNFGVQQVLYPMVKELEQ